MDFSNFIKKSYRDLYDTSLSDALQRLGRAMSRAGSLKKLLRSDDVSLNLFSEKTLLQLSDAFRDYLRWKDAVRSVRRSLEKNGLSIPDRILDIASTTHEIKAIERAAKMCQRSGYSDHDSWASAFAAHIDLWAASMKLFVSKGHISVSLVSPDHPEAEKYAEQVCSKRAISDLKGYMWLAYKRGERAGVLEMSACVPWDEILAHAELRLPQLGLQAKKRGASQVIEDLVSKEIEPALRIILDKKAEDEAIDSARTAYVSLVEAPPLKAGKVVAIYIANDKAPIGVAILSEAGDLLHHAEISAKKDIKSTCREILKEHDPDAAVLPISSSVDELVRRIEEALTPLPVHRVHTAAIGEARKQAPSIGPMEASAFALGRRALNPAEEWTKVDPVAIGLGEYPREIDQERLRSALAETVEIQKWKRRRKWDETGRNEPPRQTAVSPVGKRMNPMIKTIRDLKPGLPVEGVVTNITPFGVFVNIGLSTEGMIHISQLSSDFVEDPSQVVRVGQRVTARVIEVIPEKQRIALSLKIPNERPDGSPGSSSRKDDKRSAGKTPPKQRSSALADLDALFKKK